MLRGNTAVAVIPDSETVFDSRMHIVTAIAITTMFAFDSINVGQIKVSQQKLQ